MKSIVLGPFYFWALHFAREVSSPAPSPLPWPYGHAIHELPPQDEIPR